MLAQYKDLLHLLTLRRELVSTDKGKGEKGECRRPLITTLTASTSADSTTEAGVAKAAVATSVRLMNILENFMLTDLTEFDIRQNMNWSDIVRA